MLRQKSSCGNHTETRKNPKSNEKVELKFAI